MTSPAVGPRLDPPVRRLVPERADWHAHGMDWAFVEATDPAASDDWTTDDVARAFAAGAALAERLNAAEIERLRPRVMELEAQCEAGAGSETRWIEWLTEHGLLHHHQFCKRPDGTSGQAWVLRTPAMVNGDSCEAWHPFSAACALRRFLEPNVRVEGPDAPADGPARTTS